MKKGIIIGIILIAIVVIGYFVFIPTQKENGNEFIKIGVITPLTGEVASWGKIQQNATELALKKLIDNYGVNGRKVRVIYEDSKASAKEGLNAFTKLYEVDSVNIVVGVPASNVTLAIAPVANKMQKVLLSSGSTAMEVGNAGPYIFRIMPSDEVQAKVMSDWAKELGFQKISIIYVNNSWGDGLMKEFKKKFESSSGQIINIESTGQNTTDFRTQLANIKKNNPDAIYAPLYTRSAGLMIRQAREMGMKQQILGADVYNTPDLIAAGGEAVNGVLYTQFSQGEGKLYEEFAAEYKSAYDKEPETYAGYCYDVILIAAEALKNCNNKTSGSSIRETLLNIYNFYGVTGLTSFNGKTSASGKTFEKWTVKDGKHIKY